MFEFAGLPATFLNLRACFRELVSVNNSTVKIVAQRLLGLLHRDCWDCCAEQLSRSFSY